ncbi:MAG: ABC transporter transmembrane domain-containing protein, partial [Roseburia sp.]|nr:ABC transporter transmembrane domain-containing protein [Roseburia sp.]
MGWFDEQIRERIQRDEDLMADARAQMENLFQGKRRQVAHFHTESKLAYEAVGEISDFYHIKAKAVPDNVNEPDEILEFLLRPTGIMRREVRLTGKWYRDAAGALLGYGADGRMCALLPDNKWGYRFRDPKTGKRVRITKKNADFVAEKAICFYQPLPLKSVGIRELLRYCFGVLQPRDYGMMTLMALLVAAVGTIIPLASKIIYGDVLTYGSMKLLAASVLMMACAKLSQNLLFRVKNLVNFDVKNRMTLSVQSAAMMRLLSLPPSFFKKNSSGELNSRYNGLKNLCGILFDGCFSLSLTALCSLIYVGQIVTFAPALAAPTFVIMLLTVAAMVVTTLAQKNNSRLLYQAAGKE